MPRTQRAASSFQRGAFSGPDVPSIFACQEVIGGRKSLKLMYVWIDASGLKIISGTSRKVKVVLKLKALLSWEISDDNFVLSYGSNEPASEGMAPVCITRDFVVGFERALEMKEALEERVSIMLHRPKTGQHLADNAVVLEIGELVDAHILAGVPKWGSGGFVKNGDIKTEHPKYRKRLSSFGVVALAKPSPGTSRNGAAPSGSNSTPSSAMAAAAVESFPCLMLDGAGDAVEVLLICKSDGVHTVHGDGENKQVIFVSYSDVAAFLKTKEGFVLKVSVQGGERTMNLRFKTGDADAVFTNVQEFAGKPSVDYFDVSEGVGDLAARAKATLEGAIQQLSAVETEQDLSNLCSLTTRLLSFYQY